MKIGIIGAGEMGGTLTRQYTRAGHDVKVSNASGPEKLKSLALETGASAVKLADVTSNVDVIIISIPLIGILSLPQALFKNIPANTVIIDTGNYYPIVSGVIKDIEDGIPESVWASNHLQRPVVKAYNNILYRSLMHSGLPRGNASRLALPIAGDDKQSKEVASVLINDSGFDSLDYGSLQDSWKQQPGSPVYCTDLTLPQLKNSIGTARKELLPERRELGLKYILKHDPKQWKDNVKHNRNIYDSVLSSVSETQEGIPK
jgi:8-hydroxy-5-deazaflavin:NADPH oxidoreductase